MWVRRAGLRDGGEAACSWDNAAQPLHVSQRGALSVNVIVTPPETLGLTLFSCLAP